MSEIQHTSRAHARLNASSSHRWMMCPPSVKLSEQFEDKPSTYAEEGTFLHELCELKLHRYLGDMTAEAVEAQYAEHRDSEFYSDEAESVTDEYVAFCIETIEAVRSSCPDPLIMVEHRLDYSEYVPEGFGTGDIVIVADGVIEVIDFKSGRGVRVDANRNSQLMLYALGALLEFDPLYDIHHVRMTIVQRAVEKCAHADIETVAQLFDRYDAGVRRSSVHDIAHRGLRNPGDVADLVDRYVPFTAQFEQPFHSCFCNCHTIILLSECR